MSNFLNEHDISDACCVLFAGKEAPHLVHLWIKIFSITWRHRSVTCQHVHLWTSLVHGL